MAVLILVHVLIAIHIVQWKLTGRTLSPVEPSEAMQTLETGRINAGFVFFLIAIAATVVFGRFFCGWGCHVLFIQDACALWMKRLGVRPRAFRSRLLWWTPSILALYMFVWPTLKREVFVPIASAIGPEWVRGLGYVAPFPGFQSHLIETEFWRTFPTIAVAIPFLFICGVAVVYFLGSKGFCTYGCPYGGAFTLAERFSPAKILVDLNKCESCGHCTASCSSNVRVHEEIQIHGKVVDTGCMKCLDCVSVCPNGALSYGFASPSLRASAAAASRKRFDLSWGGEIALLFVFWGSFVAVRGIYGLVPMLMAIGVALCSVFFAWKLAQLVVDENVVMQRSQLKHHRRWRPLGVAFGVVAATWLILVVHSGIVTYNVKRGEWFDSRVAITREDALTRPVADHPADVVDAAAHAHRHLSRVRTIGNGGLALLPSPGVDLRLAWLDLVQGRYAEARQALTRRMEVDGASDFLVRDLAHIHLLEGDSRGAMDVIDRALDEFPDFRSTLELRAHLARRTGNSETMVGRYRAALALRSDDLELRLGLADLLLHLHRPAEAEVELKRGLAVRDDPRLYQALAEAYASRGRHEEGREALRKAQELLEAGN